MCVGTNCLDFLDERGKENILFVRCVTHETTEADFLKFYYSGKF